LPSDVESRVFKSKVDRWLIPALMMPPLATLAMAAKAIATGKGIDIGLSLGTALFVGALYGGLVFPLRYVLGNGRLEIRNGLCRQKIAFTEIQAVRPTRNPLSSPALSLDRLEVRWGPGLFQFVMISPTPREEFVQQLASEAGLMPNGDGWIRPPSTTEVPTP